MVISLSIQKDSWTLVINIFQDPSTEESSAILEVNLERQTIIISLYDELDNIAREVFDCAFTKETLIRLTEEYQRGSGVYNTSLFLLTDRNYY